MGPDMVATCPGSLHIPIGQTSYHEKSASMREEQDSPSSYPEGGFGWVVILACFLIHLTFYGIIQTWGVYYSAYVNEYSAGQVSPTTLAFVGTLQPAVRNLLTAGTGIVTNMLGFRTMLLSGTIIFCLGLLLASFVTNVSSVGRREVVLEKSIGLVLGISPPLPS